MWTNCRLLLFTRYPEPGTTKTRLIPELGANRAAKLQQQLTERIVYQANLLALRLGIEIIVHYTGGSQKQMISWLGSMNFVEQADGDLGQRMHSAFLHAFGSGTDNAVLIGSDIPDITADLLQHAFLLLLNRDVVIGPSQDGGYYLIGLAAHQALQLLPLLFGNMQWSTNKLYATTVNRLEQAGYNIATLTTLRDIDLPADLSFAKERGLL